MKLPHRFAFCRLVPSRNMRLVFAIELLVGVPAWMVFITLLTTRPTHMPAWRTDAPESNANAIAAMDGRPCMVDTAPTALPRLSNATGSGCVAVEGRSVPDDVVSYPKLATHEFSTGASSVLDEGSLSDAHWSTRPMGEQAGRPVKCWATPDPGRDAEFILRIRLAHHDKSDLIEWDFPLVRSELPAQEFDEEFMSCVGSPGGFNVAWCRLGDGRDPVTGEGIGSSSSICIDQIAPFTLRISLRVSADLPGRVRADGDWTVQTHLTAQVLKPTRYGTLRVWFERISPQVQPGRND